MILDHALDVQVFKHNQTEPRNERTAELMREVITPESDSFVNARYRLAFLSPLRLRQRLLICAEEARVINSLSRRERDERSQSNVYPDCLMILRQSLWRTFHGEARIPLVRGRARDGKRLDLTFNRAVQFDSHIPDFGQAQLTISESKAG